MPGSIRIMLVGGHPLVRKSVALALEPAEDIVVVGEAAGADEAAALLDRVEADVALVDGLAWLKTIRTRHPGILTVAFTGPDDADTARTLAGAAIQKSIQPLELPAALRALAAERAAAPVRRRRLRRVALQARSLLAAGGQALGRV